MNHFLCTVQMLAEWFWSRCVITHYTLWRDLRRACDYVTASWGQNRDSIPDALKRHSANTRSELRLMTQVVFARLVLSWSQRSKNSIQNLQFETVNHFSVFSYFFNVCLCSLMSQKTYKSNETEFKGANRTQCVNQTSCRFSDHEDVWMNYFRCTLY